MSDRMEFQLVNELCCDKSEDYILNDIQKKHFYKLLDMFGFSNDKLRIIFESDIYNNDIQNDLNLILRKIKTHYGICMYNSVLYLEDFTDFKKILIFLDGESKYILKCEFSDKYKIDFEINALSDVLI